jgi:hypothetical protein
MHQEHLHGLFVVLPKHQKVYQHVQEAFQHVARVTKVDGLPKHHQKVHHNVKEAVQHVAIVHEVGRLPNYQKVCQNVKEAIHHVVQVWRHVIKHQTITQVSQTTITANQHQVKQ